MSPTSRCMLAAIAITLFLVACSKTASDLFEQGKSSHKHGDLVAAVVHLKNAIQIAPQDAMLRFYLGRVHNDAFDGASAEKEFVKAAELGFVADGRVAAALARSLWLQGNHKGILDRIKNASAFEPASQAEIFAYRGHAFTVLSKLDQASESLAQARELAGGQPLPIVDLLEANIRTSERDPSTALAIIDRVLQAHPRLYDALALKADVVRVSGSPESAVSAYSELLNVHPTHLIARVGRSTLLIQLQRFDEAEKDIKALQASFQNHFITYFQDGLLRFRKGQFRTALDAFQRSRKLNPQYEQALVFEGMTHLYLGNAELAQRALNQYHTARPEDLLGRRMLASALVRLNEVARALEIIAPVLNSGEPSPEFWELAGEAYARMGDLDKAAQWLSKVEQAKPDDPSIQQKQAELNMRRGRPDLALADYADAARLSKKLSAADTLLVVLNLRARDFERAYAAVKAMEEKAPGEPFTRNLKGVVLLEQGKLAEATATFQEVLKSHPAFLPAAANLARIDLGMGKAAQAKARFEAVLAVDKNHMQALLALAGFEQRLGKAKDAIALLERAADAHPATLEPRVQLVNLLLVDGNLQLAHLRAEEAVTRNPGNAAALELLAQVKTRQGDLHSAVATLARIVDLNPKRPAAYVARARAERAAGMTKEAEASLRRALALDKAYASAQAALFELFMQQGRLVQASEFAQQLRTELPKSPIGYIFEAEVALFQKNPKEAVSLYRRALALARTPDLAARLYQVRVFAGEGKSALVDLSRWVEEHPKQREPRAQLAQALLGEGDHARAIRELQIVLQLAPADPVAARNLAWAYYKSGDLRLAVHFAEGAKKLSPDDPFISDTLGWLLLEQGKTGEARELLAKAAAALKDRPEVRYHYAAALMKSGDTDRAIGELNTALSLNTPFPERKDAEALLARLKR